MNIRQFLVGSMANFTYVVSDGADAAVIDPSWDLELILDHIRQNSLNVHYVINTHGHFDHVHGNAEIVRATGAKIVQHKNSELEHDMEVSDGDHIRFGSVNFTVYHTPGHSKDSICLASPGVLFTGDTLFVGSCGRVDLPGGDPAELYDSLFGVLCGFGDDTLLYPGHDYGAAKSSTISVEKRTNPVLQYRSKEDFVALMG